MISNWTSATHSSFADATYCHEKRNYGIYWEDGDSEVGDLSVTLRRIEDWYVKTGQLAVGARIQSGAPFALRECCLLVLNSVTSTPQWILTCIFTTIRLSAKQHCEEHSHSSIPSMRSDSPLNSATTR